MIERGNVLAVVASTVLAATFVVLVRARGRARGAAAMHS